MIDKKSKFFMCIWLGIMLAIIHFSTESYKYIISITTAILFYFILVFYDKLYIKEPSI